MMEMNEEDQKYILMDELRKNMSKIDVARSLMCILSGVMTGILGYTGLQGFLFFIAVYIVVAVAIAFRFKFNTRLYTNMSFMSFISFDLQKHALSFVLFWTLSYALVYIY
jgi:hypothetical protein